MTHIRSCPICKSIHVTRNGITVGCGRRKLSGFPGGSFMAVRRRVDWANGGAWLQRNQAAVLSRLMLARQGEGLRWHSLADWLWGEREDGGPLTARNGVKTRLNALRRVLFAAGAPVTVSPGKGTGSLTPHMYTLTFRTQAADSSAGITKPHLDTVHELSDSQQAPSPV